MKTRSASHTSGPAAVTEPGRRGGSPNWAFFSRSVGAASTSGATLRKERERELTSRSRDAARECEPPRIRNSDIGACNRSVRTRRSVHEPCEWVCESEPRRELAECMIWEELLVWPACCLAGNAAVKKLKNRQRRKQVCKKEHQVRLCTPQKALGDGRDGTAHTPPRQPPSARRRHPQP